MRVPATALAVVALVAAAAWALAMSGSKVADRLPVSGRMLGAAALMLAWLALLAGLRNAAGGGEGCEGGPDEGVHADTTSERETTR